MGNLKRVEELYHEVLARPDESRAAFLAEACAGDDDLRRDVESLLARANSGESFLDPLLASPTTVRVERVLPGQRLGPCTIVVLIGAGGPAFARRVDNDGELRRGLAEAKEWRC